MSILTKETILKRLKEDLIIRPILDIEDQVEESSINIRLGTKLIVTRRTEYGVLQPSELSASLIRKFQAKLYYRFGQRFLLHPRQLILASTFEFIGLPNNLSAHVLSRSRYGRAGLMVATATYVHPGWKGTLTLELFNYGDVPIELECGAPIAQLVIEETAPAIAGPKRGGAMRHIPTQPEFVEMKQDKDWPRLQFFRKLAGLEVE
jgi:dCTP deaminase